MEEFIFNYFKIPKENWWYVSRNELINLIIKKYVNLKEPKIIDIGCGCGILIEYLKNKGFKYVKGIDVEKKFVDEAIKRGNNVILCDIEKDIEVTEKYDVVILSDVIEHIENDKKVISNILDIMNKGGLCILFVPSFKILWSWHDVINGHKRRYLLRDILRLFDNNNVNFIICSYWNFLLFFPALVIRVIKRVLRIRKDDFYELPRFLNFLIKKLLFLENLLILNGFKFPFGVSALCVFKKI